MKIFVLTDNYSGSSTLAEHGLSYLIEHDGKRILFDTGQSDVFLRNAEKKDITVKESDIIVLSHGHYDHGNGLDFIKGMTLICHSGCFRRRYRRRDKGYIGLKSTQEELSERFNLTVSDEPLKIGNEIFFLGEIPRLTEFESKQTPFMFEDGNPDYVMDDSALAIILDEGLFVITGCGHAGIVNTLEHARRITGINKLVGILGGFHLKEQGVQLDKTISYLKENKLKYIMPSHCTELPALSAFHDNFGIRQVRTGDILSF
jgi:7,8-dihydropterin-6-yl-methyl-4-(beta-D-ribofuranosyl)aminobenzene 5'-phosphate synthase